MKKPSRRPRDRDVADRNIADRNIADRNIADRNIADKQPAQAPRYWTGAHTTHKLRYHLVLVPKYRKRVLKGAVAARLEGLIRQACAVNGWEPEELAIQPDHAHLLLQAQPRFSVAQIMRTLKGGTARVLRQEFPELEEFLWGDSFWADGYFAATVGVVEGSVVTAYIQNQRQ